MQKFKIEAYKNLIKDFRCINSENLFIFLGKVQETFGYVPQEVVYDVAARTGFSETQIYGALTSYRDFEVGLDCEG